MISRLMLNLQNPLLFETRSHMHTTNGTGTYVGPFVTTIVDREVETISASGFISASGTSGGTVTTGTDSTSSRSGPNVDELQQYTEEGELEAEMYGRPRNALWYDRAWVSGSGTSSAVGTRSGARGRVDELQEEVGKWLPFSYCSISFLRPSLFFLSLLDPALLFFSTP